MQELVQTLLSGHQIVALIRPGGSVTGHFVVLEQGPSGIQLADPWTGMTTSITPYALYAMFWTDAVVV